MNRQQPRPPRLARRLVTTLLRDERGRDTRADLSEEFEQIAVRDGAHVARGWYRRQAAWAVAARIADAAARVGRLVRGAPASLARLARFGRDLQPATRSIRRAPWYSATIVAVVALSIALSATVFAVVDGVLFKPLPYDDVDRLVAIEFGFSDDRSVGGRIAPEDLDRWQAGVPDVPLAAVRVVETTGYERLNEPGLGLAIVRPTLLEVLGVRPILGGFTADDRALETVANRPVRPVLLTWEFWQERFDGDRDVIGRVIDPVDPAATPIRVAGILPPGFVVPATRPAQLVMPAAEGHSRAPRDTTYLARLPDGVSPDAFDSRLEAAMRRSADEIIDEFRARAVPDAAHVLPLNDHLRAEARPVLRALFAAAAVLVLIACLNVSGLMTARGLDRARDIGLRRAIGARARDIVSLLVVEHGVLFAAGAVLGLALAVPLLQVVLSMLPADLYLLKAPAIDVRVAGLAALALAASLVLASLWPIRRALRPELQRLVAGHGSGSVTFRSSVGSQAVMAAQVAATLVLVVAGGLIVGSLLVVKANDLGYDADRLIIADVDIDAPSMPEELGRYLLAVRALPGVTAAGAAETDMLTGRIAFRSRFDPLGRDMAVEAGLPPGTMVFGPTSGFTVAVTPGFFEAAGSRAIEGRLLTDDEARTGAPLVVVSRSYARDHFAGDAVGQFVEYRGSGEHPPFEIVGVIDDVRIGTWDAPAVSAVLAPHVLLGTGARQIVFARVEGSTQQVLDGMRQVAERMHPALRPVRLQTANSMLAETIRVRRLQSWLFGSFAGAGLLLAGVGLLGFVAMTMARRTREVGIRMALGATRQRVVSRMMREQLLPVVLGLAAGGLLSAWSVRFLESYMYELSVYDARIWVAALAVVAATTLAGALIPSWRASRVDPVRALRVE